MDDATRSMGTDRASRALVVTAVAAGLALAALTVAVLVAGGPLPGEVAYIRWWQGLGAPVPVLADIVRHATSTEANLLVAAIPAVWAVRRFGRRGAAAVLICLASMLVVQPVSKELVDRGRPAAEQVDVRRDHSSRSYPSGHSLSTATIWGVFALFAWRTGRRRVAALLTLPVAVTFVASAVHGVHWPSDAVAGTIVGAAAALWAVSVLPPGRPARAG